MNQSNPWARLLDSVVGAAGNILPGVLGRRETTSAGVPNASGTATAAAAPNAEWIKWAIGGGIAIVVLIIVASVFKR